MFSEVALDFLTSAFALSTSFLAFLISARAFSASSLALKASE
jgi:hypothetical protein